MVGAIIGAAIGLLIAPRRGAETSAIIRAQLLEAQRKAAAARAAAEGDVLRRYDAVAADARRPGSPPSG